MPTPLEEVMDEVNKTYGPGTLLQASKSQRLIVDRVPFGILSLDLAIGGGCPRGRMTMFKGEYSAGKSALAMKAVINFQHYCRYCCTPLGTYSLVSGWRDHSCACKKNEPMRAVWLDAEHSFDADWARRWGIDTDELLVIQTEFAEQGIDVTDKMIRSGQCDLVVVDSVAALTPSIEIQESAEKWQMGVAARLMNKAMRKWTSGMNAGGLLCTTKCTIILINQMRLNISGYGSPVTSPGGKGIDFFESVEVRLKKADWMEEPGSARPIGMETEFVVVKNKTAPPMRNGRYSLFFVDRPDEGYKVGDTDNDVQVLRSAVFWDLVKKAGSWFTINDTKYQGEDKAAAFLRADSELLARLESQVREREERWIKTGRGEAIKIDPDTGEVTDDDSGAESTSE